MEQSDWTSCWNCIALAWELGNACICSDDKSLQWTFVLIYIWRSSSSRV